MLPVLWLRLDTGDKSKRAEQGVAWSLAKCDQCRPSALICSGLLIVLGLSILGKGPPP